MHEFKHDFYGIEVKAVVLGYIRPELDFTSRGGIFAPFCFILPYPFAEALIEDIEMDKRVAINSLDRPEYRQYASDPHFKLGA